MDQALLVPPFANLLLSIILVFLLKPGRNVLDVLHRGGLGHSHLRLFRHFLPVHSQRAKNIFCFLVHKLVLSNHHLGLVRFDAVALRQRVYSTGARFRVPSTAFVRRAATAVRLACGLLLRRVRGRHGLSPNKQRAAVPTACHTIAALSRLHVIPTFIPPILVVVAIAKTTPISIPLVHLVLLAFETLAAYLFNRFRHGGFVQDTAVVHYSYIIYPIEKLYCCQSAQTESKEGWGTNNYYLAQNI